jgi:hypothetical protein
MHSIALAARPNRNCTVGLVFAAAILITLALQVVDTSKAAISLSIITMLLAGFTAYWRFSKQGIDALGIFCLAFAIYDGLILFRLATIGAGNELPYPTTFSTDTYSDAGVLVSLAATVMCLTTLFWETLVNPVLFSPVACSRTATQVRRRGSEMWFWSGLTSYVTGLVMYFLQFAQLGGYVATLSMDRGERFSAANDRVLLSYPFGAFIVPGLAAMIFASYTNENKLQRFFSWLFVSVWCVLIILQGDRRLVLQAVLAIVGVLSVVQTNMLRLRFRTWVLIFIGYALFSTFGSNRYLINLVAGRQMSIQEAFSQVSDEWSGNWIAPENTEFAGPYFSLLSVVSESSQHIYGESYYDSFLFIVPKALYPGQKPELLTHKFDQQVHQGGGTVYGWGYNPVAEAFLNFGTIGVAVIFVLWSVFFLCLAFIKQRGVLGLFIFSVLLSESVNANRIDFRDVYCESVYLICGVIVISFMNRLYSRLALTRYEHVSRS